VAPASICGWKSPLTLLSRYALVTPARNEQDTLGVVGLSLSRQTTPPAAWIIVDDHSTDRTWLVAQELERLLPFTIALRSPNPQAGPLNQGAVNGRDVLAFEAGVRALAQRPEFIGKLDADVGLSTTYYQQLLARFHDDPKLGIAGGSCFERGREVFVAPGSVRGAARLYRWECWEAISPLEQQLGWDGVDLIRAQLAGWTTQSFREIRFDHLRPAGERR
jgi:biofilm PGA synthesis N-glycosyltransferase PgaC